MLARRASESRASRGCSGAVFHRHSLRVRSPAGRSRCGQGRAECRQTSPWIRWLRLSLVAIWTVSRRLRQAGSMRSRSGTARTKLPPRPTKARDLARDYRLAGLDGVQALLARRLETILLVQPVERNQFRLLGDADGALALNIRMSAHRADTCAPLADIAAEQQQVGDHLYGLDALTVLGQAHAVDADHRGRPAHRLRLPPPSRARVKPDRFSRSLPRPPRGIAKSSKPCVCSAIKAWSSTVGRSAVRAASSSSNRALQIPGDRRDIAAGLDLMILRADLRRGAGQHLEWRLRIGEALQAAFAQRIESDDRHAARRASCSACSIRGLLLPTFWPKKKMQSVCSKSSKRHRSDRHADAFGQRDRGALVAHIRAVGQVVGAVKPRHQRVHIGRFERSAARGVEDDRFRIVERLQLAADRLKRLVPFHRDIAVGLGFPAHRAGQPARLLEIVVAPGIEQSRQRVAGKECGVGAAGGELPGRRLRAVLAELEYMRIGRLGPGAAHAGKSVRLVLSQQGRRRACHHPLSSERAGKRFH